MSSLKSSLRVSSRVSLWVLVAALIPVSAAAKDNGYVGASGLNGTSCNGCHTPSGNAPTVAFQGPNTLVRGITGNYSLTVTGGAGINAGVDIAVEGDAVLMPGPGMRLDNDELTHSQPKAFADGKAVFTFSVTARSLGAVKLYASGLSGNGNNQKSGDNAAQTTMSLTVTSTGGGGGATDGGTVGGTPDAGTGGGGGGGAGGGTADGGTAHDGGTGTGAGKGTGGGNGMGGGNGTGGGSSGTSTTNIPSIPPAVNLLTEALGTDPVSGSIVLRATATAPDGIAKVTFLLDGDAIGVITKPAYTLDFDTTGVPNGQHVVEVEAVSTSGLTSKSDNFTLSVANHPVSNAGCDASGGGTMTWVFLLSLSLFAAMVMKPKNRRR